MTRNADWNHVEPVGLIVAVVVMPLCRLVRTVMTFLRDGLRELPGFYRVANRSLTSVAIRVAFGVNAPVRSHDPGSRVGSSISNSSTLSRLASLFRDRVGTIHRILAVDAEGAVPVYDYSDYSVLSSWAHSMSKHSVEEA